ncbi:MAG: acyl-CoA dehydrogenase family protein [Quisquiliibacterium sp.]
MNVFDRLDASLPLSDEEKMLLSSVRELATKEIAPRAGDYDKSGEFPWENLRAINALGLNQMFIPEQYGGAPLSYRAYLACVREISQACASTGIIWAGSDATGMKTRFTPDGDQILVDGGKTFITNGDCADLYLLFGKWTEIDDPKAAISALIVEKGTPGLSVVRTEEKMGHRASSTATIAFDSMRVPRANLLCDPGDGLRILFGSLNKSRPSVAAHALGIARAAWQDAVAYINEREQSGRRIVEFQGIQFMLADMATDLAQCEGWLWHVAGLVEADDDDFGIEASMLKMRASDLAMKISTEAVQLLGGYGYCRDHRVERLMRDAKITQIWEGTNQVHRQLIGRSFMNKRGRS